MVFSCHRSLNRWMWFWASLLPQGNNDMVKEGDCNVGVCGVFEIIHDKCYHGTPSSIKWTSNCCSKKLQRFWQLWLICLTFLFLFWWFLHRDTGWPLNAANATHTNHGWEIEGKKVLFLFSGDPIPSFFICSLELFQDVNFGGQLTPLTPGVGRGGSFLT